MIYDKDSKLGPGQTIVVSGSSDITISEMLGIYVRFGILVLIAIIGIIMARKIMPIPQVTNNPRANLVF